MTEKTLKSIFSKYTPESPRHQAIFEAAENAVLSGDKEKSMYQVTFSLPFLCEKKELYAIENQLCELYGLTLLRLLPRYPEELFDEGYLPEVLTEAARVGVVANGFFRDYTLEMDEDAITISVPFTDGGIDLLALGRTGEVISGIIRSEFGLDYTVSITQREDYQLHFDAFHRQQEQEIREWLQRSAEEAAAYKARKEQEETEEAEKNPVLRRVASLFAEEDGSTGSVETVGESLLHIGALTFDISDPQLLFGEPFTPDDPTPLRDLNRPARRVIALGQVFKAEATEIRGGDKFSVTIGITDKDSSVFLRTSLPEEEATALVKAVKGGCIAACGSVRQDKFGEWNVSVRSVQKIKLHLRPDNAETKRVELHMHTNLSAMDATATPEEVIRRVAAWGQKAIAITDHGNVQAFPTAMLAAKGMEDFKVIYGMEGYFVDDTARALYGRDDIGFDEEMIVFDIETTGLDLRRCKITEIGAVRVQNGKVIDRFNTFVDPGTPIPEEIVRLTGITDEMVAGAPKIDAALGAFLDYAGNRLLIAHNAGFDTGFIRRAAEECGMAFENPYLDTLAMSRYVNPELKNHKLDTLAKYFDLGDFNHHRASDDAEMLAEIFFKMIDKLEDEGVTDFAQMTEAMSQSADPLKLRTYHQILLVKNLVGLKNLYRLISESYLNYYYRRPRIPKTRLTELREGLILGSACEAGELFQAILEGKPQAAIEEIAEFYDYLEIQPIGNNRFMVEKGEVADDEALRELNRKIVALGEKLNKPVCATCDAHYMDPEDEIYRRILLAGMKSKSKGNDEADSTTKLYMRTTEEMLTEFSYLGEEKAYEVVVTNPNRIADMVEKLKPIPDGFYPPHIEGCEEELTKKCHDMAKAMYGDPLPEEVSARLERELESIIKNGFAVMYIIARRLVENSEAKGYQVGSRGSVGSSFAAMMAGITKVNSLPPHYRCPDCLHSEFVKDGSVKSGFDLPPKDCPNCGRPNMIRDGHDIPFETFLGFYGDKTPDIDLNFSGDVQSDAHKYTETLFGKGHAFRAGTIGTLADKTAFGFAAKYLESRQISVCRAEQERLISGCVGVKRTTGQHPGGVIVVPQDREIYDFCPVQHPADDASSDTITTHFEFKYLHDTILKLDNLGHDIPTKYKRMEEYTNTNVLNCDLSDPRLYQLFTTPAPMGITQEDLLGVETGTLGLPEMNTKFVRGVLIQAQPKTFSDLLQISGLTHGTGVWLGNADALIKAGICTISDVIGCRDDIMLRLIQSYQMDKALSFKITEDVRKGKGLKPEYEEAMVAAGVPDWYIDSCKKIKYMFPKAHAAAYVIDALRLGWYKLYYPKEFYAAFFTAAPGGVEASVVTGGLPSVRGEMERITDLVKEKKATAKDNETFSALQLINEAMVRGIRFLPVDLKKSHAGKFLPEAGGIRLPFNSIGGLGDTAADHIMEARDTKEIFCVEDLRVAAKLSKSVIEVLSKNGVFEGMSETNQLSFL